MGRYYRNGILDFVSDSFRIRICSSCGYLFQNSSKLLEEFTLMREYNGDINLNLWASEEEVVAFAKKEDITESLLFEFFVQKMEDGVKDGSLLKKVLSSPMRIYMEHYREKEAIIPSPEINEQIMES